MSNIQPIVATSTMIVSRDAIKNMAAHKKQAKTLSLALSLYLDNVEGDKAKETALRASAKIGRDQCKAVDALPRDPAKLRQYVESVKQKIEAIVAKLPSVSSFAAFNDCNAVRLEAKLALGHIEQFLKEYQEAKKAA